MSSITHLAVADCYGNPDQPRQTFDAEALRELADSIKAQGLIQPITVTPRDGRFMIVAGERRWRAHVLLGEATIAAIVVADMDEKTVMLQAIIENAMRKDVNIIEEAVAYGRCVTLGMSPEELAAQLGVAPFRVRWRLSLLQLREEYRTLARAGHLTPDQAKEMAKLEPRDQDRLFRDIKAGACSSSLALNARRAELQAEAAQGEMFNVDDKPSEATRRLAQGFEAKVRRVSAMLRECTVENQIVAVHRVDPTRADTLADLMAAMRGDLERIERALRAAGRDSTLRIAA